MKISFVIPLYNEEDTIALLFCALEQAIQNNKDMIEDYEVIFVDDGSTDKTYERLAAFCGGKARIIRLTGNSGQSNALRTGFKASRNDIIITLDGDLQSDPSEITGMLKKLEEGYDCVCGWRYERNDPVIKKMSSRIANSVRRYVLGDNFKDISCSFKVLKRGCVADLNFFNGFHRFLPLLIQWKGYKVTQYKVRHYPRRFGKTKYGLLDRCFKTVFDLFYVKFFMQKRT